MDAPDCTRDPDSGEKISWNLGFAIPGTAIRSKFNLPVFRTFPLPAISSDSAPRMLEVSTANLGELLAASKIQVVFTPAGRPQSISCGPRRYQGAFLFLLVFNLIWTGASIRLIIQKAPWTFLIVFPGSAALIWASTLWLALHRRVLNLSADQLEIKNRCGPFTWNHSIPKSQILTISHLVHLSSGNTRYFRVRMESVTGLKLALVDGIQSKPAAVTLISRLDDWRKS